MMNIAEQWKVITSARLSAPVPVDRIPERLGIDLREAFLSGEISGMIERSASGFAITINAADPDTRKRFTLAHELGHYMLHRHLIGDGLDDDRAYRSTQSGKYHNTRIGPAEETEANRFAANLLMPMDLINAHRGPLRSDVQGMARLFGVSKHSMSIRLGVP